jgi:Flp pilus assembly protein TadD
MTFHKAGREEAAVEQYRRAIELNPTDASFRIALGLSYERLQRPADAVAAYSEYLRLEPSGSEAEKVRARLAELAGPRS